MEHAKLAYDRLNSKNCGIKLQIDGTYKLLTVNWVLIVLCTMLTYSESLMLVCIFEMILLP